MAESTRFSSGETFGRYVVESLLGEGGMGEVYRALDTRLGRKVALKVLRKDGDLSEDAWAHEASRMLREARAAAALSHAGIVAIYDVGELDGTAFIAMEIAEGEPLRALVGGDAADARKIQILHDVARALAAAHQAGLVHRDVKPENIVVSRAGTVKVLDFGIARGLDRETDPGARTLEAEPAESLFHGTPAYTAPEQLTGEALDARTDQFGWGVVAHELFEGELPFRADKGPAALMSSILADEPRPMNRAPEAIRALVKRALAKDPADRFPSMTVLADELALLSIEPEPEPTPLPPAAARVSATRALALVAVLAALAAAAWFLFRREKPVDSAPVAPTPSAAPLVRIAITDLPLPTTDNPEALVAYREGVQAVRDASWTTARFAFDRARKADPSLALAHLRYAMVAMDSEDLNASREAYRVAFLLRSSLSDRDRSLLDALEPFLQRDPPDVAEMRRRFADLSARYPGDAELVYWEFFPIPQRKPADLLAFTERCLALDDRYADCLQIQARALIALGRHEEARRALDRCVEVAPTAGDCMFDRAAVEIMSNRCVGLEEVTRSWVAREPDLGRAHSYLACSLYGQGRENAAVRAVVDTATQKLRASGFQVEALTLDFGFAAGTGDFESALRIARQTGVVGDIDHEAGPTAKHVFLLIELGRTEDAGRVAQDFLARQTASLRSGTMDCTVDPEPSFYAAAHRAGLLSEAERASHRESWIRRCVQEGDAAGAWYGAYALPATTPDEAREALAAMPSRPSLPEGLPYYRARSAAALRGKVRFLAGDMDGALPDLVEASSHCGMLLDPVHYLQNQHRLGVARETRGEKDLACEAYRSVLSRWGAAKDSITARDVARRAKALGCESRPGP
ncbi:serine/threonine-protein kinase [Polyangium jinanense]|uniref:Protein kinase n=1 Tax=Polyangium jinanense TaxID=2829994 RepID=A0A9X3X338_9BACT|nr:serine/threonine-protein kinase [Polyangium jinanense]MDC3952857.1 protein kinase [Polyangium jinanense]MDC3980476.1 protein kinase [Polyangium jinanense]